MLAGGRSRRMAGKNKALLELAGKPLLRHVTQRLQPQCSKIYLSVEAPGEVWEEFGLPQIADLQSGSNGPLGGVLAALQYLQDQSEWLMLVPCDAPFLPLDLAVLLLESATEKQCATALVSYQGHWQPTFSLWHREVLPDLRRAVLQLGHKGLKEFLQTQSPAVLAWEEQQPSPFFNINHPSDLAEAAHLLDPRSASIS